MRFSGGLLIDDVRRGFISFLVQSGNTIEICDS